MKFSKKENGCWGLRKYMSDFAKRYRKLWEDQADMQKSFGLERMALFGPAAASQEPMNLSRMWRKWGNSWLPWQFGDWVEEALAVHKTAFIGDWSALSKVLIKGRDAVAFLQRVGMAALAHFPIGRMRHFICMNEQGKIAIEGILSRLDDEIYFYTGGGGEWLIYHARQGRWDIDISLVTPDYFMFEIQGPKSGVIIEHVCEVSIKNLAFNHWMPNKIAGIEVRILRTGVSGELGYEIHGAVDHGAAIWAEICQKGEACQLVPLGARAQVLAHVEAGIATVGFDYIPATLGSPVKSQTSVIGGGQKIIGTYEFADPSALFRSPLELNWGSQKAIETLDFIGAEALREELKQGGPQRKLYGLVWDCDDVVGVYKSLFDENQAIALQMDLPRHYAAEYFAVVMQDGACCGVASSRVYSPQLRRMISLAVLDKNFVETQRQVIVLWGRTPKEFTEIKARIINLPFKADRRREPAMI